MIECAQFMTHFMTIFCVNKAGYAIYDAFSGNFSENKNQNKIVLEKTVIFVTASQIHAH